MASKSQSAYMIAMSLIISASQIIAQNYKDKPGREWIKAKTKELESMASDAIKKAHGGFDKKELGENTNIMGLFTKYPELWKRNSEKWNRPDLIKSSLAGLICPCWL